MKIEVWRDIIGYEGLYVVSNLGNVRSVDRTVVCKNGRKRHYKSVMLKPCKDSLGYRQVNLSKNGVEKTFDIYPFVARAFPEICGKWFEGCEVDHIIPVMNGGTDEATNLQVCTHLQNMNNEQSRKNISEAHKGKTHSEEHRRKIGEALKGEKSHNWGKHLTEETKRRISEAQKGEKNPNWGKHLSEETKRKMSEALKGEKCYLFGKFGAEHHSSKPVLQYSKEGVLIRKWDCAREVTRELGIAHNSISACCKGKRKSAGGYVWKYKEKEAG